MRASKDDFLKESQSNVAQLKYKTKSIFFYLSLSSPHPLLLSTFPPVLTKRHKYVSEISSSAHVILRRNKIITELSRGAHIREAERPIRKQNCTLRSPEVLRRTYKYRRHPTSDIKNSAREIRMIHRLARRWRHLYSLSAAAIYDREY